MKDLTKEQVHQGIVAIVMNAAELVEEAEILLGAGKTARAYGLAYFACEELGKLPELASVVEKLLAGKRPDWKKVNKAMVNHDAKALNSFLAARTLDLIVPGEDDEIHKDHAQMLGRTILAAHDLRRSFSKIRRREEAFYVDVGRGQFELPSGLISRKETVEMITMVRSQVEFAKEIYVQKSQIAFFKDIQRNEASRRETLKGMISELDSLTPVQIERIAAKAGFSLQEIREFIAQYRAFYQMLLD
jgi:AbiV family abortive infection protein